MMMNDYGLIPKCKIQGPSVIINEFMFPLLNKDTMEIEQELLVEICPKSIFKELE